MKKHHINTENHKIGTILNIPILEVRKIKVWRKGRGGEGAIAGIGIVIVSSAVATAGYDPDEASGIVLSKGQFFVLNSFIAALPGAAIGALIGSVNKKVQRFIINGYNEEYYKIRENLKNYFIGLPVIEGKNIYDELSRFY